ncbi:unnamed protein product [Brugia timori]|uniref:Uncharacterized protein n=1 Tax=Brugia timori TaxID=42155 RepID=A0A0R3QPU8_9BILA|nr:unnamed protein product [Brugia timori]
MIDVLKEYWDSKSSNEFDQRKNSSRLMVKITFANRSCFSSLRTGDKKQKVNMNEKEKATIINVIIMIVLKRITSFQLYTLYANLRNEKIRLSTSEHVTVIHQSGDLFNSLANIGLRIASDKKFNICAIFGSIKEEKIMMITADNFIDHDIVKQNKSKFNVLQKTHQQIDCP